MEVEAQAEAEEVYGNVRVNLATFAVSVAGTSIELTYFEFELFRALCREANRVIFYDDLCEALWGTSGTAERRRLSVAIFRLRTKLSDSWPFRVETVRGRGYGFISSHQPVQA